MQTLQKQVSPTTYQQLSELFISRVEDKRAHKVHIGTKVFLELLERGVDGAVLTAVSRHIPKPIVVKTVGSDQTNLSKLIRKKHLSGKQTEELNDLTNLWQELREFFAWDEASVKDWISCPVPALEGTQPSVLIASAFGRAKVRECLEVMKYGDLA
jgi:uncharacterized protein (DUF2384 family)